MAAASEVPLVMELLPQLYRDYFINQYMDPGTLTNQDSMESNKVFFVAHLFIDFSHKYLCVLTMHLVESSVVRCSSSGDFFTKTMKVATNFMVGMSFMILKGFIIIPKVVLNLCKSWICSS